MKNMLIISIILSTFALTACDNAEQKRREECTKARNDGTDAVMGRVDKSVGQAASKKWDELKCHSSDVITH